jgi:redox-sensing transcriptional repressor
MPRSKNDKSDSPEGPVPKAVVSRLSLYLRELQNLLADERETTSSTHLGSLLGFTDAQVRKDLAYFGQFGYPGIGYRCQELVAAIRSILGTDKGWPVVIVGMGNLGRALLGYRGFSNQGFRVMAAFDINRDLVGKQVEGVSVYHLDDLQPMVSELEVRLGIVAVPSTAAQAVADQLVAAGIDGILNFAPVTLSLPEGVSKVGVDLAIELEQLTFAVVNKAKNS